MTRDEKIGLLWGLIGVLAFSLTLPASRVAAPELGLGFTAFGRAIGAGLCAALILLLTRQPWPARSDLPALTVVALGVVLGFPFLTTLAMMHVPASHGAVVIGLLPLTTAIVGVTLTGERPVLGFWLASFGGTALLIAYLVSVSGGQWSTADLALVGAVIAAACGYGKGAQLAGRLGGWQVICWALLLSLPPMLVAAVFFVSWPPAAAPTAAWVGFAYLTLVSQLTGFFAWYFGLSRGGIARVSQVQLLQLFFSLAACAWLLGEHIDQRMLGYAAAVVTTVAIGTRLRIAKPKPA